MNEAQRTQDAIYHLAVKLQTELGDHNSAAAEFRAIQSVIAESYATGAADENEACAKLLEERGWNETARTIRARQEQGKVNP